MPLKKIKFDEIKLPYGRQEQKVIAFPLKAPFIVVHQGYKVPESWNEFCKQIMPDFTLEFKWGECVYQNDGEGHTQLCGYWYDSSD